MRSLKVTVTTTAGVVLEAKEITVRDGVYELHITEVVPGTTITERSVAELEIGTQGTVWHDA